MLQDIGAIVIVLGACAWLGYYAYRFFVPNQTGGCAGGCCSGGKEKPAGEAKGERTVFISADDLTRRLKARRG